MTISANDDYSFRAISDRDVQRAVDWAAAEGWNPGHADANCFATVDPEGFMGGWLGDRMIASISVVNYDSHFAFLGFYIVAAPYRGRGYGYRLWQHGMGRAGDRLVGLDGVVAEQDNYRRSGFELAYRNVRYGGSANSLADIGAAAGLEIAPLETLTPAVADLDRALFPAQRDAFLRAWIAASGHVARAAYRDGTLAGYGILRPCRSGHKIGPLFAEDRPTAEALLGALWAGAGLAADSGEIFLDVPEPNAAALSLAQDLGLTPVFETARMYTGRAPDIALDKIFGVTTFELG